MQRKILHTSQAQTHAHNKSETRRHQQVCRNNREPDYEKLGNLAQQTTDNPKADEKIPRRLPVPIRKNELWEYFIVIRNPGITSEAAVRGSPYQRAY